MSRHGNAKKPTAAIYHRTDASVIKAGKSKIKEGKPLRQIYEESDKDDLPSVSQLFRNPRQLYNIKRRITNPAETSSASSAPIDQQLIRQIQESKGQYMQSLDVLI